MEKIIFKNKGETGAIPINADNLNLMQDNVENSFKSSKTTSDIDTYNCNYINNKFSNLFTLIKDLGDISSYEGGYANIDISSYDIIVIECKDGQTAIMIPAHQGNGIFINEDWVENADTMIRRKFWKTGNNDIQFDNAYGYGINGYSSFGVRPTYCIPRYIYGVKF